MTKEEFYEKWPVNWELREVLSEFARDGYKVWEDVGVNPNSELFFCQLYNIFEKVSKSEEV